MAWLLRAACTLLVIVACDSRRTLTPRDGGEGPPSAVGHTPGRALPAPHDRPATPAALAELTPSDLDDPSESPAGHAIGPAPGGAGAALLPPVGVGLRSPSARARSPRAAGLVRLRC